MEDPPGNPVELFQPTRFEARLAPGTDRTPVVDVKPVLHP